MPFFVIILKKFHTILKYVSKTYALNFEIIAISLDQVSDFSHSDCILKL